MANFIRNLRNRLDDTKTVHCPRCLNEVEISSSRRHFECPHMMPDAHGQLTIPCRYQFPPLYVQNYGGETKPVPVQVFGWSSHGKTVYLDALRLMLIKLETVWSEYSHQSITDRDIERSNMIRTKTENGVMPDATVPLSLHDNYIYIMHLRNMLRWGSRFFVMMDHAGERFDSLEEFEAHEIPFLTHRDTTTMMFISPALLRGTLIGEAAAQLMEDQREAMRQEIEIPNRVSEHRGRSMNDLLTIYIQAMITHDKHEQQQKPKNLLNRLASEVIKQIIQQRRKLVVVLTMSDMLMNEMPPRLRDYLTSDDMWDQVLDHSGSQKFVMDTDYMDEYLARMDKVSDAVKEWLKTGLQDIGGADFVKNIEANNIEARYTLVSALGHNEVSLPRRFRAGSKIAPKRVLDPFFWVLELERKSLMG